MFRSRRFIIKNYGAEFWKKFKAESRIVFKKVLLELPDIGKSIFSFNYAYAPAYIAWYKSMRNLGLSAKEADSLMWKMNECMILTVPKIFLRSAGRIYLESFRKKAASHIERQKNGNLHENDWLIEYRNLNKNSFEIDIKRCGFITLSKKYGAEGMLPGICAVDYIVAHYMGNGFSRTKTLGGGDDCCNCRYEIKGKCPLQVPAGMK
ncbi:L-2-amino-thiazoline-4-carboxylic acid hydrolase [uncultured Treponema sp.]|uniref:L-2-amino-thiazoline-4-carboxylic acid hydrolase n=1 Tax=uncultured Treponema sp. TaxID=162155 RepID=UPI0025DBD064|nr:L-2-amino-thiazoline-4-carboxylic acid hydrolase [uncultured Treponema sp.]